MKTRGRTLIINENEKLIMFEYVESFENEEEEFEFFRKFLIIFKKKICLNKIAEIFIKNS